MKKIFITIMAIVATLSPLASHANVIDQMFVYETTATHWDKNEDWTFDMISNSNIFDVKWKTHYIVFKNYLNLGIPNNNSYVSELYSINPIEKSISSLAIDAVYMEKDLNTYVRDVKLIVSDKADFSNPIFTISHDTSIDTYPHFWYFDIPEPAPYLYYKFQIETMSVQSYVGISNEATSRVRGGEWLSIQRMGVYWAEVLAQPSISVSPNQNGEYTLMSESGELHALIVEYDKNGNVVKNHTPIYPNGTQPVAARTVVDGLVDLDDTSWRNKVAGNGETFSIPAPETEGNYLLVRAKSVYRTNQSEELLRFITTGGVTTGVKCVDTDQNSSSPEYYTLSGIPVAKPANGIYIRVKDGKAEKVRL